MTSDVDRAGADAAAAGGGRDGDPDAATGAAPRGGPHAARVAAIAVGVVLVLLIVVLATRKPPEDRFGTNPVIGHAAPKVAGTVLTGDTVDIDSYRGKWVVVNFFATWCVPCQTEAPELVAFTKEHDAKGDAKVVSVAFQDTPEALKTFFEQHDGSWPVVVGDTGQIAIDYGVTGIPESFVIDPRGRVVAHFEGVTAAALDEVIASAMAGTEPAK